MDLNDTPRQVYGYTVHFTLFFSTAFNALYMCPKIRCDEYYYEKNLGTKQCLILSSTDYRSETWRDGASFCFLPAAMARARRPQTYAMTWRAKHAACRARVPWSRGRCAVASAYGASFRACPCRCGRPASPWPSDTRRWPRMAS